MHWVSNIRCWRANLFARSLNAARDYDSSHHTSPFLRPNLPPLKLLLLLWYCFFLHSSSSVVSVETERGFVLTEKPQRERCSKTSKLMPKSAARNYILLILVRHQPWRVQISGAISQCRPLSTMSLLQPLDTCGDDNSDASLDVNEL